MQYFIDEMKNQALGKIVLAVLQGGALIREKFHLKRGQPWIGPWKVGDKKIKRWIEYIK